MSVMTQPADLSAALEEIRQRSEFCNAYVSVLHGPYSPEQIVGRNAASAADVPRLLAVVDAVLRLLDEARPSASFPPADCTNACSDGPCNCSGKRRAAAWNLDPETIREAISHALGIAQSQPSSEEEADHGPDL